MTHLIKDWSIPPHIQAVQTSKRFQSHQAFCLHPDHQHPALSAFAEAMDLPQQPQMMQQVHGDGLVEITADTDPAVRLVADACFTRTPGLVCSVMTADCLPVLLTDVEGSFVAAVHCGWRSLYANILQKTMQQIDSPHRLLAWFGPAIGAAQYEVSADFVEHYLQQHPTAGGAFAPIQGGHSFADLRYLAQLQLPGALIHDAEICTLLHPDYYSWRGDRTPHRMASLIWIQPGHR